MNIGNKSNIAGLKRKILILIFAGFILCFSFFSDFVLKRIEGNLICGLQQYIYWPFVALLFLMLIFRNKPLRISFSKYCIFLFLIIGIGFFLRSYKINSLPLHFDEANETLGFSQKLAHTGYIKYAYLPISYFFGRVESLFSLFVYLSSLIFKHPALIIRWPAIIIGTLTILIVYFFTREYYNGKAAVYSALFLAILPWHVILSRTGVRAILAPLTGLLIFFFLLKAIKKKDYPFLFLSSFLLSIGVFYTYTASHIYVIIYLVYLFLLRKQLTWVKSIDILICFLLFLIPLYPFLEEWPTCNFLRRQYYLTTVGSYWPDIFGFMLKNTLPNWKESINLLFLRQEGTFNLFAPSFRGPIIYLGLLPLFLLSLLRACYNIRRHDKLIILWLILGFSFSTFFLKTVEDRHLVIILPLIPILQGNQINIYIDTLRKYKQNNILKNIFIFIIVIFSILGIAQSLMNYTQYISNNTSSEIELKRYSFGAESVARFLNEELAGESRNYLILADRRMPVYNYLAYLSNNYGNDLFDRFLSYWVPGQALQRYEEDVIHKNNGVFYFCLWSPETRADDWDAKYCRLHKIFRQLHPKQFPVRIIFYPNGKKAVEIYKIIGKRMP